LNQYNLFVSKKAEILFVDTDSYATAANKHSGILLDDIRDWTTMNIDKQTDAWAYDILSFWAITFCHPFKWVVPSNKETLEQRIKTHKSFLSKIPNIKIPALYEPLTGEIVKQFSEIFAGRRYMVNFDTTPIAVAAVIKQQVISTSLIIRELLTDVIDVIGCQTQIAVRKDKWLLIETKMPQITRQVREIDCDILFPAFNTYAYETKGVLYSESGKMAPYFYEPEFYYADSYLSVIDYGSDKMWNFNLNNQLAGIDCTSTPIFSKSIIVRDAAIQNFGGSKFLNIPVKNTYGLINVPLGTKNAYYTNNHAAIEYKDRSSVKYQLFTNSNPRQEIDLDFLPYFAAKDSLVFIPEDGFIEVYKNGTIITKLDASICTRDSKLFGTDAGIILFDNKTIYLLNTKK